MEVTLTALNTGRPLVFAGGIAGICYGKEGNEKQRAIRCLKNGHHSVFEHIVYTWLIEGISRTCSHQLVRHRLASYTQESQRYKKYEFENDWYVMPDIPEEQQIDFELSMRHALSSYKDAIMHGVKPEDARFILPNATKTTLYVTMNAREFMNFYKLRAIKNAQWEIRELAEKMLETISEQSTEMKEFAELIKESK